MAAVAESPNDALTTKSLLSSACRSVTPGEILTLQGFMELAALCEAVVVLDTVRVISSTDRFTAPLTDLLSAEGVLSEFKPTLTRGDALRLLQRLPADLKERLPGEISLEHLTEPRLLADTDHLPPNAIGMLDTSASPPERDLDDEALIRWVESLPDYPSTMNAAPSRARVYRAVGYLLVATTHGLDYFPDADRSPFVGSLLTRTYRSLPQQIYGRVAEAWNASDVDEVDVISEWDMQLQIPIPPITARVLAECRSLSEVGPKLLELRDELAGYRRHFREFKAELQSAGTTRQRRQVQRKYQQLLQLASGPDQELVNVHEVLSFGEQFTKAATAPLTPTSYSATLLTQPVDWIRRWWTRRPLAVLFRMDAKIPNLSTYGELIDKLWGEHAQDQLLREYVLQARRVERLALSTSTPAAGSD